MRLALLLSLLISFLFAGCVRPPDVFLCAELKQNELAWCTYTISDTEFYVDNDTALYNGKKWTDIRRESLIMPAESYAKIKTYILTMCKKHNDCNKEFQTWETKTRKVESRLK